MGASRERDLNAEIAQRLGLVHHIVRNHFKTHAGSSRYDDMVSDGTLGLWGALERYGPDVNGTLAGRCIQNSIVSGIRRALGRAGQKDMQPVPLDLNDERPEFAIEDDGYAEFVLQASITALLGTMSLQQREAFHHLVVKDRPVQAVGDRMGVTAPRVSQLRKQYQVHMAELRDAA